MRVITSEDLAAFLDTLHMLYPGFQLVTKSTTSARCTTFGSTVYVPSHWPTLSPAAQYVRLCHESVHLQQFALMGVWRFLARYAMWSGRFELERAAFAVEMRTVYDIYGAEVLRARERMYIANFTGKAYYWCASEAEATAWVSSTITGLIAHTSG